MRRPPAIAGLLALLVFAASGLVLLPDQVRGLADRYRHGKDMTLVEGVPRLQGLDPATPSFVVAVRARVPERDRIRLLVPGRGVAACNPAPAQLYFLSYQLLPRPVVCDESPRWWVLYRTPAVALPPGARVLVDMAPGLRLVDTRPGTGR